MSDDTQGPILKFFVRAVISGVAAVFVSGPISGAVLFVFTILGADNQLDNAQVYTAVLLSSWVPWYMYLDQLLND